MGNSNSLTVKFVEQLRTPGVYRDGFGLLLRVEASGAKRWVLRTTVNGKRRDIGLGSAREVTLREARDEATSLRKLARSGRDPVAHRRKIKREQLTFAQAAEKVHAQNTESWRNGKHVAQWISTLRTYAVPMIGKMPVGDIQTADVLRVLMPIWVTKPETHVGCASESDWYSTGPLPLVTGRPCP